MKYPFYVIVVGLTILFISCSTTDSQIDGTWQQRGFGRIMYVEGDKVKIFVKTSGYCNQLTSGNFSEHFRIVEVEENELVINYGSPRNYYFQRIEKLPQECLSREENLSMDPMKNFDVLWNLFDDNYAFFEHRNIDWDQVKIDFTPKIKNVKTQQEFYQLLKNLLDSLKDGHVKMNVPDSLIMQRDNIEISFETIKNEIPRAILENYVGSLQTYNYGTISWGKLKNTNIGYIVVPRMYGFPDYGLTQQEFNNKSIRPRNPLNFYRNYEWECLLIGFGSVFFPV